MKFKLKIRVQPATVAIALGLFLIFVLFSLPMENLKGYIFGKIYEQTGATVRAESLSPSFLGWPGLSLRKADVDVPLLGGEFSFKSEKLTARVGFAPFRLTYSMKASSLADGGSLYAKVSQPKQAIAIQWELDEVGLALFHFTGSPPIFGGTLSSDGSLSLSQTDASKTEGKIEVQAKAMDVKAANLQGFVIPPMQLGSMKTDIRIRNGAAEIVAWQFGSPSDDIFGSITGSLKLGTALLQSMVDVTIQFQVSEKLRQIPAAASVLTFLDGMYKSQKTNDYRMRWHGPLEEIMTRSPLPQKAD